MSETRKTDLREKKELSDTIYNHKDIADKFRADYNKFMTDGGRERTPDETSEVFKKCMKTILETKGEKEFEEQKDEEQHTLIHNKGVYSFRDLFNLFTILNAHSDEHDRIVKNENNIERIFKEIQSLKDRDESISNALKKECKDIRSKAKEREDKQEARN